MRGNLISISQQARKFVQERDWANVMLLARQIMVQDNNEPEGHFLYGMACKYTGQITQSIEAFKQVLALDSERYDAAIELAFQYLVTLKHNEAFSLVSNYEKALDNSPLYLHVGAKIYSGLGMHINAWPLYVKANEIQPNVDMFKSDLASCAVLLGKVSDAKMIYQEFIDKYPLHQKNHYELSKLEKVKTINHIEQMKSILDASQSSPDKNIFMYYALGKEFEDLKSWKEAFEYYDKAGKAVLSVANYNVDSDVKLINQIIKTCSQKWLNSKTKRKNSIVAKQNPIFVVGLPRTGTTLVERILSCHSEVESADETFFLQMAIRQLSGTNGISEVDEKIIERASNQDIRLLAQYYMQAIKYRLSDKPMFIDKYPYNYLYLGFVAKAFPNARIVYLKRDPMDACLAMFKQSFFKFAYSLDDLGKYYVAQDKLRNHWNVLFGDRIINVEYEALVNNQEKTTKQLLKRLGLEFEPECLAFEKNPNASATASTLQVREKIHTRSVGKWKYFKDDLMPLKNYLINENIKID
ncbi:MAG: sulfotransferase [Paraglaciecola sp.]|uniref:tetratricopeptide repeat-containing sulfotransferase family protein n=1 Tax=Paraglaciecola sp. TaxID=1920173 RepID=UPI00329769ED